MSIERTILHIDQNSFFASVEMLDYPELRKVPMAVGGDQSKRHGIILAKNNLAARLGVKTAQTLWEARQKCPGLVVVPGHYEKYSYYSEKLFNLYCMYTDRVEPYGLDECWLDLTHICAEGSGPKIADEMRRTVREEFGLTCSVGVSFNKTFAKLGSDYEKPDATTHIPYCAFRQIVWPLPVEALLFVGKSTARKLSRINIKTIGQLAGMSSAYIKETMGQQGLKLWLYANGKDESEVSRFDAKREVKSIGNSTTTSRDMHNQEDIWQVMVALSDQVASRLRAKNLKAGTVQIWIRDSLLSSFERQKKLDFPTHQARDIAVAAMALFKNNYNWSNPVRGLGVRATSLHSVNSPEQISFFDGKASLKVERIDEVIDKLRLQYGNKIIKKAIQLNCDDELIEEGQLKENRGGFSAMQDATPGSFFDYL